LLLIAAAGLGAWFILRSGNTAPEVRFVKPRRETLVSNLPTNGKVEPIEWTAVRVDAPGLVERLPVHQGQTIVKGALLAQIGEPGIADQVRAAQARVAQAQAEFETLDKGGRSTELSDIANQLTRAKFDRDQANKEYGSLRRLNEKNAATAVEVEVAHARVQQLDLQMQSLERQRAALVSKPDLAAGQARVQEAEAAVLGAQAKMGQGIIRSPLSGVVYDLPARQGAYLNAGDLVASVGQIDRLRVRVYVDEPEVGRIAVGQPVRITWDALPNRDWQGHVERLPTQIAALGTRQVGEVLCSIDNPGHELVPGTNVNAFIQTSVVPNALTVPKETIQRKGGATDVYVLGPGDTLRLRRVEAGTFNVTRTQVTGGLKDEDLVALPSDKTLKDGARVKPGLP
jgi:HlyD family secretion protein